MFTRTVAVLALIAGIHIALGQEAAEAPGLEAQFQKIGVDARVLGHLRGAFKRAGVNEDKIDLAVTGVLKTIMEMKAKGQNFQMNPELRDHLKNEGA